MPGAAAGAAVAAVEPARSRHPAVDFAVAGSATSCACVLSNPVRGVFRFSNWRRMFTYVGVHTYRATAACIYQRIHTDASHIWGWSTRNKAHKFVHIHVFTKRQALRMFVLQCACGSTYVVVVHESSAADRLHTKTQSTYSVWVAPFPYCTAVPYTYA